MTDREDFVMASENGLDRNPITQLGKVVYNGYRDDAAIKANRARHKRGMSKYPGPVGDAQISILPREPVIRRKVTSFRTSAGKENSMYVVSTVAGMGDAGQPLHKLIEEWEVVGVATNACMAETNGRAARNELVIQTGGTTTVKNSGMKRINNGDAVMVDWPNPAEPFETGSKNSDRQPLLLIPYDPQLDRLTRAAIFEYMFKPRSAGYEDERNTPLAEGSEILRSVIAQISLQALHVGLASGVVKLNEGALENNKQGLKRRRDASDEYFESEDRVDSLKKMALYMHACGTYAPLEVPSPKRKGIPDSTTTLKDMITRTLMADKSEYLLMPTPSGSNKRPRGLEGDIINKQKSAISDLIAGPERVNGFKSKRILGVAQSPAEPGESFDIILGRYQI